MTLLSGHGIRVDLPAGFEGRIYQRTPMGGSAAYPVAQFATFPLPADVADFGGGVTVGMAATDIFAVLFEYGPESVGKALFSSKKVPSTLTVDQFFPYLLRRGVGGQSGTQRFFTEAGRPFTFYAVLGSHALRPQLVPHVNTLLSQIAIAPGGTG